MARIDWTNLTFSGKDLLTYGSFCFAISGLYYKNIITDAENKKTDATEKLVINQKLESAIEKIKVLEETTKSTAEQIRVLQDNELKRSAIESSGGYVPFKKK